MKKFTLPAPVSHCVSFRQVRYVIHQSRLYDSFGRHYEELHRESMVETRQARFQNYVIIMTTLFVVISTFADMLTLIDMLQARKFPPLHSELFYLLIALSVIIGGFVLLMFGVLFSNWRFRRKHLARGRK
jgi:hypothetical protein